MIARRLVGMSAAACLLAACSNGPVRKVHPSTAGIQQLAVQADGSWKITLRIQNYSTFPMHYSRVDAKLSIDGREVGDVVVTPDIDIVANNGDVVDATLQTSAKLPRSGDFGYQLKGTITTGEPKAEFRFDKSSRLSPVPGVPDTYR